MSCACGHHHPKPVQSGAGAAISLARPMIALTGRLICHDTEQMMTALSLLPEHVRLSRAEPGCLRFDIWQDEDPMVWNLSELFADADAFAAHQKRTAVTDWGEQSHSITRDFVKREISPVLREEQPSDIDGIDRVLREAFGGTDEARLVAGLRAQGDLQFSLVAEAGGVVVGHLGFSPLTGDVSALALAPVAVAPKLQRRGVGAAMIHHALGRASQTPVIVLGDPEYYRAFGFAPVALNSPYAGPYLQAHGKIAPHSHIRHADAFGQL